MCYWQAGSRIIGKAASDVSQYVNETRQDALVSSPIGLQVRLCWTALHSWYNPHNVALSDVNQHFSMWTHHPAQWRTGHSQETFNSIDSSTGFNQLSERLMKPTWLYCYSQADDTTVAWLVYMTELFFFFFFLNTRQDIIWQIKLLKILFPTEFNQILYIHLSLLSSFLPSIHPSSCPSVTLVLSGKWSFVSFIYILPIICLSGNQQLIKNRR